MSARLESASPGETMPPACRRWPSQLSRSSNNYASLLALLPAPATPGLPEATPPGWPPAAPADRAAAEDDAEALILFQRTVSGSLPC